MYSVRRAALRAASCSSRAVAVPRQQVASFAIHLSKASTRPAATLPLSRFFSQTAGARNDETPFEQAQAPESTSPPAQESEEHGIFVSNMTFDATDLHLREAYSQYGEIKNINIGRDGRGLSRGFGFVTFTSKDAADKAVSATDNTFWHGRRINVQHRKSSGPATKVDRNEPKAPSKSLYIGNIPYETSDTDLNDLFKSLEGVVDVRVAVDRQTGWPRGFAHADFGDQASADRAFQKLSSHTLGGRMLRVDYTQPKRDRGEGGFDRERSGRRDF